MSDWISHNLMAATLMMLLVLSVRRPVARLFGPSCAYTLWLLPAVLVLLPPLPPFPSALSPSSAAFPSFWQTAGSLQPLAGPGQWDSVLITLWIVGAAAFMFWQTLVYRDFLTRLSLASRSSGSFNGLPLIESEAVEGPLAVGLLDRRIVVPARFSTRYELEERRLALEHELTHHRRGDVWWNLLGIFVLSVNWFNPIAYLAFRAFRADQELACDEAVLARATASDRHAYALALVKSASRPEVVSACPLNQAHLLKRRLRMLNSYRNTVGRKLGAAATMVGATAVAASFAVPGVAQPTGRISAGDRIIIMADQPSKGASRDLMQLPIGGSGGLSGALCDVQQPASAPARGAVPVSFCGNPHLTPGEKLSRLENVRRMLVASRDIPVEHKQRMLLAIDAEIVRLRS